MLLVVWPCEGVPVRLVVDRYLRFTGIVDLQQNRNLAPPPRAIRGERQFLAKAIAQSWLRVCPSTYTIATQITVLEAIPLRSRMSQSIECNFRLPQLTPLLQVHLWLRQRRRGCGRSCWRRCFSRCQAVRVSVTVGLTCLSGLLCSYSFQCGWPPRRHPFN